MDDDHASPVIINVICPTNMIMKFYVAYDIVQLVNMLQGGAQYILAEEKQLDCSVCTHEYCAVYSRSNLMITTRAGTHL